MADETVLKVYPAWRYHKTEPAVIVNNPDEDAQLGDGWADTPAAFIDDSAPAKKGKGKNS